MRWVSPFAALLSAATAVLGAIEPLPPPPDHYVSDSAEILSPATISSLAAKLDAFERETSSQVLVATFPRVPDDYAMEDFTQRTAESWGVGQKADDNGAVFFIFSEDRKMRIEVGYGLEGAIPDATAKNILDREVTPRFRAGDFDGGVTAGVTAILAAAQGEYGGTGRTNADGSSQDRGFIFFFIGLFVVANIVMAGRKSGTYFGPRGRRRRGGGGFWFPTGGGSGRSGSGFGGGGGFSGGGGGFGGGGASGGW